MAENGITLNEVNQQNHESQQQITPATPEQPKTYDQSLGNSVAEQLKLKVNPDDIARSIKEAFAQTNKDRLPKVGQSDKEWAEEQNRLAKQREEERVTARRAQLEADKQVSTPFQDASESAAIPSSELSPADIKQIEAIYPEVRNLSALIQKGTELLPYLKDPQVIAAVTGAIIGAVGMATGNEGLTRLTTVMGFAALGVSRGKGIQGKFVGAMAGAAGALAVTEGLHHSPIDSNLGNTVAASLDDVPTALKIGAVGVNAVISRLGK